LNVVPTIAATSSTARPETETDSVVNEPVVENNSKKVQMELLLDNEDDLTILKISPEESSGGQLIASDKRKDSSSSANNATTNSSKFFVLHKLPNGGALNLENLKTYNMDGVESGKMPEEQDIKDHSDVAMGFYDEHESAAATSGETNRDSFDVSEGNDGDIPSAALPLPQPRPQGGPVYIIEEEDFDDHPYYVSFQDPAETSTSKLVTSDISGELEAPGEPEQRADVPTEKPGNEAIGATDDSKWIPIGERARPTFGPANRPPGYVAPPPPQEAADHVTEGLSSLADVTSSGEFLQEMYYFREEPAEENVSVDLQLLPKSLASVLDMAQQPRPTPAREERTHLPAPFRHGRRVPERRPPRPPHFRTQFVGHDQRFIPLRPPAGRRWRRKPWRWPRPAASRLSGPPLMLGLVNDQHAVELLDQGQSPSEETKPIPLTLQGQPSRVADGQAEVRLQRPFVHPAKEQYPASGEHGGG